MPDNIITGVALSREYLSLKYEKTPEIRAEFPDVDSYVAFKQAEAAGRVRIIQNCIVHGPRPSE